MDWDTTIRVIEALGPYAWPAVALVVAILFRQELRAVFRRVRKGKFLGQEFELDPEVEELKKSVEAAVRETAGPEAGTSPDSATEDRHAPSIVEVEPDDFADLLKLASERPTVAVMQLAALLEREVRLLAASLGVQPDARPRDIRSIVDALGREGRLPPNTRASLEIFWRLRNRIVHGLGETDEREVLSVLDVGMTLLRLIQAVPHEVARVHRVDVELFEDATGERRAPGVGLILAVSSPGGVRVERRIYPTTREGYYQVGARVAWTWNLERIWPTAWYRDEPAEEFTLAWNSAGEFIGDMVDLPQRHPTSADET